MIMATLPRIAAPCTEDLDSMARTERGSFCDKCQHEVVDLRRAPKKKALTMLADLKRASPTGRVCVRTIARPDGTPVFGADPPGPLARYAAPLLLATSLAACAPSGHSTVGGTTPVALVRPVASVHPPTNQNGPVTATVVPVPVVTVSSTPQPASIPPEVEMAGEMVWDGGP